MKYLKQFEDYGGYVAEQVSKTTDYVEYLAEHLDSTIKYSEYIAEQIKTIGYGSEPVKESGTKKMLKKLSNFGMEYDDFIVNDKNSTVIGSEHNKITSGSYNVAIGWMNGNFGDFNSDWKSGDFNMIEKSEIDSLPEYKHEIIDTDNDLSHEIKISEI